MQRSDSRNTKEPRNQGRQKQTLNNEQGTGELWQNLGNLYKWGSKTQINRITYQPNVPTLDPHICWSTDMVIAENACEIQRMV